MKGSERSCAARCSALRRRDSCVTPGVSTLSFGDPGDGGLDTSARGGWGSFSLVPFGVRDRGGMEGPIERGITGIDARAS
jgi:hypothetical protein